MKYLVSTFLLFTVLTLSACGGGGGGGGGGDAPAPPAPPPTQPKVEFLGGFVKTADLSGNARVSGEVVNNGDGTATFTQVKCTFYDGSSNVIGTDSSYAVGSVVKLVDSGIFTNTALKPSEKGGYMVWTTIPATTISRFECYTTYNTYKVTDPAAQLTISGNVTAQKDALNHLTLLGKVKNVGSKGLVFGKTYFFIRKSTNELIYIDFNYIKGQTVYLPSIANTTDTALTPNAEGIFNVSTIVPFSLYGSHEVRYDWTDADISNATVTATSRRQLSFAEEPTLYDKKADWDRRNREIRQLQDSLL